MSIDLEGWVEWKHTWLSGEPRWHPLVDTQVFALQTHFFRQLFTTDEGLEFDNGLPEDVSSAVKALAGGWYGQIWMSLAQLLPYQEVLQSDPGWKALYEFMLQAAVRLVGSCVVPADQHMLTAAESVEWVRLILWFH